MESPINRILGSRRAFLGGSLVAGLLGISSTLWAQARGGKKSGKSTKLGGFKPNNQAVFDLGACKAQCLQDYEDCYDAASKARTSKKWKAAVSYPACWAAYMACLAACDAQAIADAAAQTASWLAHNPAIVGTVVVIGGVTYIVLSGGSGLALFPILAL